VPTGLQLSLLQRCLQLGLRNSYFFIPTNIRKLTVFYRNLFLVALSLIFGVEAHAQTNVKLIPQAGRNNSPKRRLYAQKLPQNHPAQFAPQ
jgi:hypothetical protein